MHPPQILIITNYYFAALPFIAISAILEAMNGQKTVVVGLSGGVDSSVSALLLKQQGYKVIGLFMKNWEETTEEGFCHAQQDFEDVTRIAEKIDIPYYSINLAKEYWENVFTQFLEELKAGLTPNPDVLCNREIKFKAFFEKALTLGADSIATGHYCQTARIDGAPRLLRGSDPHKDQSYFLHAINSKALSQTIFPIGHLEKSAVRQLAHTHHLATATKRDSTGICFIGKRKFSDFVSRYIGYSSGPIETLDGTVIGTHQGVAYHTIGQRKGLGIGGPGAAWFVAHKDISRNALIVVQGENHPALFAPALTATDPTWIGPPPPFPLSCTAKVRYRSPDVPCTVHRLDDGNLHVLFDTPQRALTPRQSVVFYDGPTCLGGALIAAPSSPLAK